MGSFPSVSGMDSPAESATIPSLPPGSSAGYSGFSGAAAGKTSSCPKRLSAGMLGSPCTESVSREEAGEGSRRAGTAEAAGRGGFCAGFSGGVAEAGLLRPSGAGFSTRFQSLLGWPPFQRICPFPTTMYLVVVNSRSPIGPREWSFWVEMPISAPSPNSAPSVKRVEALR